MLEVNATFENGGCDDRRKQESFALTFSGEHCKGVKIFSRVLSYVTVYFTLCSRVSMRTSLRTSPTHFTILVHHWLRRRYEYLFCFLLVNGVEGCQGNPYLLDFIRIKVSRS